MEESKEPDPQ